MSDVTYEPFGPLTAMTYGNAIAEPRSYDLAYRLGTLATGTVQSLTYGYDAADRATAITDGVNTVSSQKFGYDTLDHLSSATGAYGAFSWTYDAAGNRLTQNAAGAATTYSYAAKSNVLTKLVKGSLTTTVVTSAAGNTLTVTPSTGSAISRTYNKAERLVGVQTGSTQTAT